MGYKPDSNGVYNVQCPHGGGFGFHAETLQYHSSWDWIMPVVEKIEKTNRPNDKEYHPYTATIWANGCCISDGNNGNKIIEGFHPEGKLSAVYEVCLQFIQWYNEQK